MLRKKAADELKRQQEVKAEERRRVITERTGKPKPLDDCNEGMRKQHKIQLITFNIITISDVNKHLQRIS